jgi:hypothetical protein
MEGSRGEGEERGVEERVSRGEERRGLIEGSRRD